MENQTKQEQQKDIRYWLEQLVEPYRSEALSNWIKQGTVTSVELNLPLALISAFDWELTEQGYKYWRDVYNNLGEIHFL